MDGRYEGEKVSTTRSAHSTNSMNILAPAPGLGVQGDAPLIVVEVAEEAALLYAGQVVNEGSGGPARVPCRGFDQNDVRPEVSHEFRADVSGDTPADVQDS